MDPRGLQAAPVSATSVNHGWPHPTARPQSKGSQRDGLRSGSVVCPRGAISIQRLIADDQVKINWLVGYCNFHWLKQKNQLAGEWVVVKQHFSGWMGDFMTGGWSSKRIWMGDIAPKNGFLSVKMDQPASLAGRGNGIISQHQWWDYHHRNLSWPVRSIIISSKYYHTVNMLIQTISNSFI